MGISKEVLIAIVFAVVVGIVLCRIFSGGRDNYQENMDATTYPGACIWLAREMRDGGEDERLVRNMKDQCSNYHALCGKASGGAEVLSIYDSYGNNWDIATDVLAQDMDVAGKNKNDCIAPLKCNPNIHCPAFLRCQSGTCQ